MKVVNIIIIIILGKISLLHRDLPNYQTDLFKIDIFRKIMIYHY